MNINITRMRLLGIFLRIEIGLPFALLEMPFSLIVGTVFAIANYLGEIEYKYPSRTGRSLVVLSLNAFINAVVLGVGLFSIGHLKIRVHAQDVVDIARIKAIGLLFIIFGVAMTLIRVMLFFVDTYLITRLRNNDQRITGAL